MVTRGNDTTIMSCERSAVYVYSRISNNSRHSHHIDGLGNKLKTAFVSYVPPCFKIGAIVCLLLYRRSEHMQRTLSDMPLFMQTDGLMWLYGKVGLSWSISLCLLMSSLHRFSQFLLFIYQLLFSWSVCLFNPRSVPLCF